jgi:hypothetical protein
MEQLELDERKRSTRSPIKIHPLHLLSRDQRPEFVSSKKKRIKCPKELKIHQLSAYRFLAV